MNYMSHDKPRNALGRGRYDGDVFIQLSEFRYRLELEWPATTQYVLKDLAMSLGKEVLTGGPSGAVVMTVMTVSGRPNEMDLL